MVRSYTLSTEGAKRSARGGNGTRRGCNFTQCTRLATGLGKAVPGSGSSGIRKALTALPVSDGMAAPSMTARSATCMGAPFGLPTSSGTAGANPNFKSLNRNYLVPQRILMNFQKSIIFAVKTHNSSF